MSSTVTMEQNGSQEFLPTYSEFTTQGSSEILAKPIVVPQKTNLFMIKTFSPFARSYSPALEKLPNPISRDEFILFIDGLNKAFLSSPIFQAAHVVGGALLGSQVLPAQAVGGVFQVVSVLGSAGVSIIRVRKYMKLKNAEIFAPRGLVVKIMTTKKMMAAIGFTGADAKGKLVLPPLDVLNDLTPPGTLAVYKSNGNDEQNPENSTTFLPQLVEDPRLRRLRALEGFISPLTIDPNPAPTSGPIDKYGGAPVRWLNNKKDTKLNKAAAKSTQGRIEKAPLAETEMKIAKAELESIEYRILEIRQNAERDLEMRPDNQYEIEARMESEIVVLEEHRETELKRRDEKIREVYKKGDKKLEKLAKKDEKIANRILWVVITRADGSVADELLEVGSVGS